MIKEHEIEYRDYHLKYGIVDDHIRVTDFGGTAVEARIPDFIEGIPVTEIAKKVFLSKKRLRSVILPQGLMTLGDWAFAYCDNLEEITFPKHAFFYGKGIFLECRNLKKILFSDEAQETNEDIGVMMAAALTKLDAYYLFQPQEAGSAEWVAKWDFKLRELLHTDDLDGYTNTVLCGEEDYGSGRRENDIDYYQNRRRREKVRMAMLRLLHPYLLAADLKEELEEYLRGHCETETWEVVLEEHPDSRRFYELLGKCGCITIENIDGMLHDLGNAHAEMKAFLLKYKSEKLQTKDGEKVDFFASFSL